MQQVLNIRIVPVSIQWAHMLAAAACELVRGQLQAVLKFCYCLVAWATSCSLSCCSCTAIGVDFTAGTACKSSKGVATACYPCRQTELA